MSCSSYCQGLQSCLEPSRLVEPCVLRLELAPSKSNISSPVPCKSESNNTVDKGGWSFLQNLTKDTSENNKKSVESDKTYVPPNFKRSASMLSEKSLEMCTESLGSETGSDGGDSGDEMALLSCNKNSNNETKLPNLKQTRRMSRSSSFPPPLTSISGSNTIQVRKHREDGRLVMEAVSISSSKACFHAERVNGRLKLHILKNRDNNEEEEEETEKTLIDEENEGEEVVEEEEEEEGLEENNGNEGVEMGMEKLARPSRCKESGNGSKNLLNWKQFLVTI